MARKDTRLTLRISSKLKSELEQIAADQGRSAAQVTEAFIMLGIQDYKKHGPKNLQLCVARLSRAAGE